MSSSEPPSSEKKAATEGLTVYPVEKSGQDEFVLDHGDDFGSHLEEFNPTMACAADYERNCGH